jgi:hypothetical protein
MPSPAAAREGDAVRLEPTGVGAHAWAADGIAGGAS